MDCHLQENQLIYLVISLSANIHYWQHHLWTFKTFNLVLACCACLSIVLRMLLSICIIINNTPLNPWSRLGHWGLHTHIHAYGIYGVNVFLQWFAGTLLSQHPVNLKRVKYFHLSCRRHPHTPVSVTWGIIHFIIGVFHQNSWNSLEGALI